MSIRLRPYDRAKDFAVISNLLTETYPPGDARFDNWPQPRWEYAHSHPWFDELSTRSMGVWEDEGKIVAVANYENRLGQAFFQVRPGYEHLKPEMLAYAEARLHAHADDGHAYLRAWINDGDTEFEAIARERGYTRREDLEDPYSRYLIPHPFPPISLPPGFQLKSLADENDLYKINRVLYRGFNHPGEPPEDDEEIAGRKKMQSGPNFRPDLNIVAVAPDGQFVAYAGLWYVPANRMAYVEPVATDPDFRRLGLGKAAVLEGIRRCAKEGATVAWVGSQQPFYLAMGFEKACAVRAWVKRVDAHR
ncbi:MAG: GNAT family N-acetyltransferase [Bacillota bacterium]